MKIFKRALATVLCVVMIFGSVPLAGFVGLELPELNLFSTKAEAATSGTCGDNLTWTFDESTGELIISGTGDMDDFVTAGAPWYRLSVDSVTISEGVTSIGDCAFYELDGLKNVTIPDSITSIGNNAFRSCNKLTSITIPASVTSIGEKVFYFCISLTSITVDPANTAYSSDDYGVLFNKDKTELIQYPTGNTRTDYVIPDGVSIIGNAAFDYCKKLINVTIPDVVTRIYEAAFCLCVNLESIIIPDSVTSIGFEAFAGCYNLKSIIIPNNVTSIGDDAFAQCMAMEFIHIPSSVTTVGNIILPDADKTELVENIKTDLENASEDDINYYAQMGITKESVANWLPTTVVCSDSENSAAKTFAEQNGNEFEVCNGHDGEIPDTPDNPDIPDNPDLITGECGDNLTWTFNESTGELIISGTGDMCEWSSWGTPWDSYQQSLIRTVSVGDGVTSISAKSFKYCQNLTAIELPDSVTSIGAEAFTYCHSLTSVEISDSVTSIGYQAFYGCESLTSITIPDGVTSISEYAFRDTGYYNDESNWENDVLYIGKHLICANQNISGSCKIKEGTLSIADDAFRNCYNLTSVTIPESVTSIGDAAFVLCKSLTSITVDSENTAYSSDEYGDLFNKDKTELIKHPEGSTRTNYVISDGVKSIGYFAVAYCDNLTSITIPDSVTSIGGAAFAMCTGLTSIEIPENVTSIDHDAFAACTGLTSITLPDSLTSIGGNAFYHCTGLTSITLPKGLKRVNGGAFTGCTGLTELVFDCVGVYMIGEDVFEDCSAFTSVIIGDEVTKINDFVFAYLSNLESVVIGNSVTSIGMVAFYRCESLTSITIPDSVTNIGYGAFAECTNLESITIGNSVTSIDMLAFTDCDKLADVYYKGTEEEWNDIEIGSDNECLLNATIHFNSTGDEIPDTPDTPDNPDIPELITGVCGDNLTWSLDESTGELVISGTGDMWDYYVFTIPWYDYCSSIKTVTIAEGVTSIGNYAFCGCNNLLSIEIPDSLTSIGDSAFRSCISLINITLDENNQYFSVDEYGVLFNKNKTKLIQYPAADTRISYSIPVGVTDIGDYAFDSCGNLKNVTIPYGVTSIGEGAFLECTALTNIIVPDSVTSIGLVAFSGCLDLTSVTLSQNITTLEFGVFGECCSLTNITIPESVTSIGVGVFDGCISLESITIPDSVTSIGGSAFNGCENLISVTLSDNITSIDGGMFCGCKNLTNIEIPHGVTSIGDSAFYGCVRLGNVILPDSVTYIGENAFCNCMAMDYIHIPSSVTQTGEEIILMDSHKAELIELFDNMSIEEIAKEIGLDNITREEIAGWSTSTLICSDSEDCFIKLYANEFGNQFNVCGGDHREEFTVTLNIDGVQTVITLKEGDAISVEDPVKEGHTFIEWTPAIPEVMPAENLEFTAVFEVNSYNVIWNIDGMLITETHKFGELMDKSKSFEKKGYTFIGWSPEIPETMPAHDLEFTAIFEINICDAVFNANGGMFPDGDLVKRIATEQNAEIIVPENPERAGYQFAGWAYNGKNIGTDVGIMDGTEGKIFDAVWIPNEKASYKVETYTMNTYGEYEVSSMLVNAFVSEVVSVDYTVSEGFEINEEKSVISGTVSSEEMLVLKVYIDRKQYKFTTVVFDTETTVLYYYGSVVTKPVSPYTGGYVFQYWEPSVPVIMPAHDVTVTAKFRETTPKPRIEMVTPEKRTIYYGESITLQVRTYDMPSYAKIKWEVSGDGVSIKPSSSGKTCKVTSTSNGNVVVKAYIVDSDGNTIEGKDGKPIYDFEYLYSEVNLWQIIVNFFRQLFGKTDTVSQIFRVIY